MISDTATKGVQAEQRRPIPQTRFVLKTPPIVEALEDFLTLIEFRDTGGLLVAPQRWGKTRAAKYLCKAVRKKFGNIPTLFVPLRGAVKRGANSFFRFFLNQAGYRFAPSAGRTETDLRNLFTECVVNRGRRSQHRMFILVIDEAQLLTIEQWGFLFDISNEVDALGVSLLVLTVGQPGLLETEMKLLYEGREEISERFLQRRLRFRGLISQVELELVLQALERTEMSPGSGMRYLSNYCPRAIENGWRLSSLAGPLWQEFEVLYQEANLSLVELPMTYVMNTINKVLVHLSKFDQPNPVIDESALGQCVRGSGIRASITSSRRRKEKEKSKAASNEGAQK